MGSNLDVTSLNLVEKAPYTKCKSFAKEGIREITCFASPLGRLYIDCEMTDGSSLWYSNTKTDETVITKAVFDVLAGTTKEANREWYTAPLYKILEATHTSWNLLHSFYIIKLKLTPEGFSYEKEGYSTIHTSEEAAKMVTEEVALAIAKADGSNIPALILELKSYEKDFTELQKINDATILSLAFSKGVKEKRQRIDSLSFLIFSKNPEASSAYECAKKAGDALYNKHMTYAR